MREESIRHILIKKGFGAYSRRVANLGAQWNNGRLRGIASWISTCVGARWRGSRRSVVSFGFFDSRFDLDVGSWKRPRQMFGPFPGFVNGEMSLMYMRCVVERPIQRVYES